MTDSRGSSLTRRKVLAIGGGLTAVSALAQPIESAREQASRTGLAPPPGPGLIFGSGPARSWDSERVSCPRALREADGQWKMWYYGRDASFDRRITLPTGRVGLAISSDGVRWQRVTGGQTRGAVFDPDPDPARFDSSHVGIGDIHREGDVYWMWYFGGDQSLQRIGPMKIKGFPMASGCAVSRDGVNWLRLNGPHRGAMLTAGGRGDFDEIMAAWPQVIRWDDGSWRMYYHGLNNRQQYTVGWAESTDGLHWEKRSPVLGPGPAGRFDDKGVATRHIVRHHGRWVMFYEGCKDIGEGPEVERQIGVAVSNDGLTWERVDGPHPDGSVIAQSPKGSGFWDHRLGCPWVVAMEDGSRRLYDIGSTERPSHNSSELDTQNFIGLAVSNGDITRWERWA